MCKQVRLNAKEVQLSFNREIYNFIQFVSSHKTDQNYWRGINADGWENEALGMRKMITQFANIPANEIKGKQLISFI